MPGTAPLPGSPRRPLGEARTVKVLVTRPAAQAASWVALLREQGFDAEALPLIGIAPALDAQPVQAAWARLGGFAAVVFVSPNAVEQFFAARPAGAGWPSAVLAATPGPGSDAALGECGVPAASRVRPAGDAEQFDSESLWEQMRSRDWSGREVLIVRGDGGRNWLAEQLQAAGARVNFISAYRREAPHWNAAQETLLREALDAPRAHLWFFSSSEAIDHLERVCAERGLQARWAQAAAIASHPRIAQRAQRLGCGHVAEVQPSPAGVAEGIRRTLQSFSP